MAEEEQRKEGQENGCPACVDSFLHEVCGQLPEPYAGKCRSLLELFAAGKISPAQFAKETIVIPGVKEAFEKYSCPTKKEEG